MPTRVVTGGVGVLPGDTMLERMQYLVAERDDLRTLLMFEPRGHAAMSGSILQPPTRPDADVGVVFIEVSGCLPMCGHGTIGTATVLVETGMVEVCEPLTRIRFDTPAGLVIADVDVLDGKVQSVQLDNVPSYLHVQGAEVDVPGLGKLRLDVAYGGNFYAILPASSVDLALVPSRHDALVERGLAIMDAVNAQLTLVHPEQPEIANCRHVLLTARGDGEVSSRGAVVIHPGWIDRSPCGTGTSARMAQLHALGELKLDEPFVHASLLGTCFEGRLVGETTVGDRPGVLPRIRGRAWLTGLSHYLLDPDDPFPAGFLLGART
jgi:proline racemase